MSKAVLILNLGTPSEPTAKGLREFYKYFFSDPFVFDMNPLGRWILRNLVVKPFRAPKTAKDYATIWMEDGSPLKVYADRLRENMQAAFDASGEQVTVVNGMAYSEPFIGQAMADLEEKGVDEILLMPMFPQYSTATTASVFHGVKAAASKWQTEPTLRFIDDLFAEPAFIRAWSILITKHLQTDDVDHVVFSYHGLPEQMITKADQANICQFGSCCDEINDSNRFCYRAQCVATTNSIVAALGWESDFYSIAFQSRFGKQAWVQPYLDEHLAELTKSGAKKIAVVTPSFVSDCLETLHEIGIGYRETFLENGGESFQLLPNLNDDPSWLNAAHEIARTRLEKAS